MRGSLLALLALAAALAATGGGQETQPSAKDAFGVLSGDPLRGRGVFVRKGCVRCHAVLGSGGRLGPELGEAGKGRSFYELVGLLWGHSPPMMESMRTKGIAWPEFDESEMADLVAYLYYLNYFDEPGDFLRGEALFAEKGCAKCHEVGGAGGSVGPRLDDYGRFLSPIGMASAMWNHGPGMLSKMEELGIPRPRFEGQEMAHVLAYIRGAAITRDPTREYLLPGDPKKGEGIFAEKGCAACHSLGAGQDSPAPDLTRSNLQRSVSEVAGIMWNHGPLMWERMREMGRAVPIFAPDEMSHLTAYLFFIRYFEREGDAGRGRGLFAEKQCAQCHGAAQGEVSAGPGPNLAGSRAVSSPHRLAAAFWNHAPIMEEAMRGEVLRWPTFRGDEVRDLVAFLRTLSAAESRAPK